MNYFFDTEFYEDGERIHLISIGIVSEDGRELYFENADFDWSIVPKDHWIQTNVRPHLIHDTEPTAGHFAGVTQPRSRIALGVKNFVTFPLGDSKHTFYGYFADYDWVVLCQLFGRMVDLPKGFPFFAMDLKQMMVERGLTGEWKRKVCPDPAGEHNALVDAKWNYMLHNAILSVSAGYIVDHATTIKG